MVGLRFQASALAAGVEARVTAPSARVGLASELTRRGASTTDVMLAGNWKTSRMVAHYPTWRPEASRRFRPRQSDSTFDADAVSTSARSGPGRHVTQSRSSGQEGGVGLPARGFFPVAGMPGRCRCRARRFAVRTRCGIRRTWCVDIF